MLRKLIAIGLMSISAMAFADKDVVGEVSTSWKMLGPNNKIVVTVFDDPEVKGVSCYLSSAKTGGISGAVGLASDTSDASVACRQTGEISFNDNLETGKEVFSAKRSLLFKELHVVRFIDRERKVLVYLTYSDYLIEGSPKNSITAVSYGLK